ncbi:MAG: Tyrosine recombinase XerD [Bacteroidia bacterium]|nr:Tyrosine recombinase XerD [Bacteroidia bacterium]
MEYLKKTIKHFLLHCKYEKRLNEKTIKAYKIDLAQFQVFILSKNIKKLREIDRYLILELLQDLHKKYKTKSIKRKIACVKAMFNHYEQEHDDFINPFRKIRLQLKEQFKLPTVMSFTEVSSIFQKAYQLKDREDNKTSISYKTIVRDIAIMELLFATGIRVSELVNLPGADINLVEGQIKVLGKGNKERVIQLCNEGLINALQEYHSAFHKQIKRTGYFFINRLHNKLSDQSARAIVKRYATLSKISKHITPHVYRHTIATMLLEENVDIKYIQKFLGHSSIVTTQIYTHVSATKQREILSEKHPRNRVLTTV